ncbi:MAG TPA: GAF domain-containing protein [Anaerolineae bacterium]|nr:GAF domain-containing protein [Anaerolineae bacterium]HQH38110.1 GAF domain-containing protein [Anaerolineae bacterium]
MSTRPAASESIAELLKEKVRQRTRLWSYALIPLLVIGVLIGLWLLATFFGGVISPARPMSLVVTAIFLSVTILGGRWGYHHLETLTIEKNPLIQKTPQASAHVTRVAASSNSRQEIVAALRTEIEALLQPRCIEIALLQPSSNYRIAETDISFSADDPLVKWLIVQPADLPLALPVVHLPAEARPQQTQMLERGLVLLIPFGKQGWMGIGAPHDGGTYNAVQQTLLQHLAHPVAVGLERAAIAESQPKRTQELHSLYWIAQAINFTTQIDDLMELIYTQLKRVIDLPNFYIALRQSDEDRLGFAFYVEGDERLYPDYTWNIIEGLTGVAIANGLTIRTTDYVEECKRRHVEPGGLQFGKAWMGVPLTAGDKTLGVMVASAFDPGATFSEEDENFFVTVAAYTAAIIERYSLNERLEARARQLGILNEIGNLLASSLDLNEVLKLVVHHAANLLNSEAGSLLLLDDESGDLVFRISSGPAGDKLVGMRIPAGKGIAGAAFAENRPVITHDTRRDERWDGSFDKKAEFITQSIIAVPLNARGHTIGVLEVINRKDARSFNQEDTELLLAFGAQAAVAIENALLFTMTDQALQARLEELTMMQQIDRQLNATLDYSAVMGQTLEWAIRITGATIGLIAALQEQEDGTPGLRFLAHRGYPPEVFERYTMDNLWPLTEGLLGMTVRSGETSLVTDLAHDPYYKKVVPGMQAQLTIPIKREERVIGVIALESDQSESFRDSDVALIVRLADHAAIAIENARLFQIVQQANDAKTDFISFVSHELKQPMTSMKGYIDLLMKGISGSLNEQQQQFLQIVRNNIGRMDRLVQDLLDISRIESGRLRLEMGQVVPEEIVSEAVQAFKQEIAVKNQTIQVLMPPSLPTVVGDRGRLIQVLTNLVSNANKYTPEGGTIVVSAEIWGNKGRDYVRWSVKDNGIGMKSDELNRLFTKYFRANNAAVRSVQGTGLGLVITRSIVEMHGGQVMVDSAYQEGSTFSFAIPIAN